ncbi:MAG TPA: GH92 family glycosyl hydrolase [Bryobacteraceae bacterium]|nr:GH92 family glycosyl hydrolase [Bryobacteraceae bacterium]
MKRTLAFLISSGVALAASSALADLPDPLVGTDSKFELSHGNTYPAVFRPFGMLSWTAQTGEGGWPYQYAKDRIQGFLATHRPSAWTEDYGPFSLMPVTGGLKVLAPERASKFRHEAETARAYYYKVRLDDYDVTAEMAPVSRGGILRFTFPASRKAFVVVDANAGGGSVHIDPASNTITGTNRSIRDKFPPNFKHYFVAVFDKKFTASGVWSKGGQVERRLEREGEHVGAYVQFAPGQTVTVRIGVSLISLEQARRNLVSELPASDFERVKEQAREEWERELGRIELSGGSEAQRRTFYTALYHAFQLPRALHEVNANGQAVHYSPYDGKVHSGTMYADNGFWDTFRAQFPLLALVQPKRDAEIIRSLLNAADEGGWLPKWPNPGYSNVMIGTHADSLIADAYTKGVRDFDAEKAYRYLYKDATLPGTGRYQARNGIADYLELGYVPADKVKESAACTLEYAYDDFCVAQMARALGKEDDYRTFMQHSRKYKNLFDKQTGFMRGRNSDGAWVEPFDPLAWGGVYTEGNAWQWLWSVQHDVPGLMSLLGGKAAFAKKLDTLFSMTTDFKVGGYGKVIHEMTEAKMAGTGQYAHINEPVHHVIYLYNNAGQPWKAQQWVRTIQDKFYLPGPAGWLGDEDTGQMSSWYIFSAMGFYPVNPGQPVYGLGTPLFDRAAIHLENGRTFTVEAQRSRPEDLYVQAVTLNGASIDRPWIKHSEILAGGVLRFQLGPEPNKNWGAGGMPVAD